MQAVKVPQMDRVPRTDPERRARRDDVDEIRVTRLPDLALRLARMEVDRLVLDLVELEAGLSLSVRTDLSALVVRH